MHTNPPRFHNHRFCFAQGSLALHKNLMSCVIIGREKPVHVADESSGFDSLVICIKPNITHCVEVGAGGADIYYFDGLRLPKDAPNISALDPKWNALQSAFDEKDLAALGEYRHLLEGQQSPPDPAVMKIVQDLYARPLDRLSQTDLADCLGLERTQALRHFKATTGQTFRKFKIWAALVAATRSAFAGEKIGLAGVEAGFSDAAHTTRTAMQIFGLTPTDGISGLIKMQTVG